MIVAKTIQEVRRWTAARRAAGQSIGFVPTMGALHEGHLSLIRSARAHCRAVAVSIFVNPTQFAPHEDLAKYPRPIERDLELCDQEQADLVFNPGVDEMYPPGGETVVEVKGLARRWEGEVRPDHFRGVATVVTKLFQIVEADTAFFGQKDFQQQAIIRRMARDLNLRTEVITCATVREADGLAMSSRNVYLSSSERDAGLAISRSLRVTKRSWLAGERNPLALQAILQHELAAEQRLVVDYAVAVDPDSLEPATQPQESLALLVAARSGRTRLLDNTVLRASDRNEDL